MGLDGTKTTGLLVDGEWSPGASRLPVHDKYDGTVVAEVAVPRLRDVVRHDLRARVRQVAGRPAQHRRPRGNGEVLLGGRGGRLDGGRDLGGPGAAFGPVISDASARRAERLIANAVARGAKLRVGGSRSGPVVAPAVLTDLPKDALLATEEAFAPVIAMATIGSVGEGADLANATRFGLQAGVFCQDLDVAFGFARRLRMGGVIINGTSSYHPDMMPYGGVKESGQGLSGPRYAVADMTEPRTIVLRLRPRD